jgi:hypothetical protein
MGVGDAISVQEVRRRTHKGRKEEGGETVKRASIPLPVGEDGRCPPGGLQANGEHPVRRAWTSPQLIDFTPRSATLWQEWTQNNG